MKIKKIILKQGGTKEFFKEVEKGISKKMNSSIIYIEDISSFKKMMTEERIRILSAIKHKKPKSIYQLAKILGRDRRNVIFDLNVLRNMGLVQLHQEEDGIRNMSRPVADYDLIEVSIEL